MQSFDMSQDDIMDVLLTQDQTVGDDELFPIIPLRDMVMVPEVLLLIFVARKTSIDIINEFKEQHLLFVLQRDPNLDHPVRKDLYDIGTVAKIVQSIDVDTKTVKIVVQGYKRAKIEHVTQHQTMDGVLMAKVSFLEDKYDEEDITDLVKELSNVFTDYHKLKKQHSSELKEFLKSDESAGVLADQITASIDLEAIQKQRLLEELSVRQRIELLLEYILQENEKIKLANKINKDVKNQVMNSQKEFFLRTQLNAIKKELGDTDSMEEDIEDFSKKLKTTPLSAEAKDKAKKEIKKLKSMSNMSAEAGIVRNYLDWLFGLPWGNKKKINKDFDKATSILNEHHYGLHKIKERICEMFALQARVKQMKGSVLCFYGPPGVGKTSLAKSIAAATGRDFVRISLGGLYDEAEIRGHRSTYIGAKPGRVIQAIRNCKTNNPVILLDEIGEIGHDIRGNPAGALLELLDPEQNSEFRDNFMEIGWDFSQALFIASTNSLNLQPALVDRLEIINVAGYTEEEKMHIAKEHLLPKQKQLNALKDDEIEVQDAAILKLIRQYTREAGVRNLERELANLCRKSLVKITHNNMKQVVITAENLHDFAGTYKFEEGAAELQDKVGVTAGLAWTQAGGDILYIETVTAAGTGKVLITGNLGKTMEQSATAAVSYVKSRAEHYGIDPELFNKIDIHIHAPEGAIPKDGPSAGIAICTSVVSALTKRAVRGDVAMTGELTLRNVALPIGGLKEKLLAAMRGGIKTVFIPKANKKDLDDIMKEIEISLTVIPHDDIGYIIDNALTPQAV